MEADVEAFAFVLFFDPEAERQIDDLEQGAGRTADGLDGEDPGEYRAGEVNNRAISNR